MSKMTMMALTGLFEIFSDSALRFGISDENYLQKKFSCLPNSVEISVIFENFTIFEISNDHFSKMAIIFGVIF